MRYISYRFLISLLFFSCKKEENLNLELRDNLLLEDGLLKIEILADSLDVPWDLAYASDDFLWLTEQGGRISRINLRNGEFETIHFVEEVWRLRTTGLLGLAVHPDFKNHPFVLVNYTVEQGENRSNKLMRFTFQNGRLESPKELLEIQANTAHNGSRIAFGPDGMIYWATGDAYVFENAQDPASLNGKILRMDLEGKIPEDNPFPDSYVWAKGFRNIQGLDFSAQGLLYSSEHGDAIEDEINLIVKGANYGWPFIEGFHDLKEEKEFAEAQSTLEPLYSWTPVIAPSGLTYYQGPIAAWNHSLLLTALKGMALRVLTLDREGKRIIGEKVYFYQRYGRLRDVAVASNGDIYISTSNQDWNPQPGFPKVGDDRILKISIANQAVLEPIVADDLASNTQLKGKELYNNYCASCHKPDGKGVSGIFPALLGNEVVEGDTEALLKLLLSGSEGTQTDQRMPSFAFLSDDQIAAITNYLYQLTIMKKEVVTPEKVAKFR
ncbi:hypothetical protein P872_12090 [Rhodonellum psychrophilum GCM71 = DSM 17998]|uniref:Cytochrome c domain-containing protein n=2 Tax=Rhodonellum TaxID=336827 RepID=U5BSR8_9BACT|nr:MULTISPECIES: PQQ-dependent sugar dehydrogenase [Rhodonellum]ERM80928.1 hypothetical protein P872_12090 [Rhodonellum psychrophilum GCM71 = DSM 17998]SDZ31366.1 Glucose/arabinose dehydrogenase, beta-propeller fold [Rhodonellum ikkaensis]